MACLNCYQEVWNANLRKSVKRKRLVLGTVCPDCNTKWKKLRLGVWEKEKNGKNMRGHADVPNTISLAETIREGYKNMGYYR